MLQTEYIQSHDITTTVAYLLGVPTEELYKEGVKFNQVLVVNLGTEKPARILRHLCLLRTRLLFRYSPINRELVYNLSNLNKMPEYVPTEWIEILAKDGVDILLSNVKVDDYLKAVNKLIPQQVSECRYLFSDDLEECWEWISNLFLMNLSGDVGVKNALNAYRQCYNDLPFQCWINTKKLKPNSLDGGMLLNDRRFLEFIYYAHGEEFVDLDMANDAGRNTENKLLNYVTIGEPVVAVIDCENIDIRYAYLLYSKVLASCSNRVEKIICVTDSNGFIAWKALERYTSIPVEYSIIDRLLPAKSLVDIKLTATICKEHYKEGHNKFILMSSDSDFWGVIDTLKDAEFLLTCLSENTSTAVPQALAENGVPYVRLDSLGTPEDFDDILLTIMTDYFIETINQTGVLDMTSVYSVLNKVMGYKHVNELKDNFENIIWQHVRLNVEQDNTIKVVYEGDC